MKKNQIYLLVIAGLLAVLGWQVWTISSSNKKAPEKKATADIVMYKRPNCTCCNKWAARMEQAGFTVAIKPTKRLAAVKRKAGITRQTASCHTAFINGYVIEGHVPARDIRRLLKMQPKAIGLTVPGMPQGAPGMPSPNPQPYKVLLMDADGSVSVFAKYNQKTVKIRSSE